MWKLLFASHSLGRIWNMEVRVAYLLYLFIFSMALAAGMRDGLGIFFLTALLYVSLFFFVFLHEMGHTLAAWREGAKVLRILLYPLGGMAEISGQLPGPVAEIEVALAGPVVSFFLAGLFALPQLLVAGEWNPISAVGLSRVLQFFFRANLFLALFNLLPVFPLDGGRIATAALVFKYGPRKALLLAGKTARIALGVLFLLGLAMILFGRMGSGLLLASIATVLYFQGGQEIHARLYMQQYASYAPDDAWKARPEAPTPAHKKRGPPTPIRAKGIGQILGGAVGKEPLQAPEEEAHPLNVRVNAILRKVKQQGIGSLTFEERSILNQASHALRLERMAHSKRHKQERGKGKNIEP
ncbi:MAG: M50 family metallopeptidase [Planctomycetota bacterium]